MKKNKNTIIIVIILAVISTILIIKQQSSTIDRKDADFAVPDTANITKIFLADKEGNKVTLRRIDQNKWTINDKYTASTDMMQTILQTVGDIEIQMPIQKSAKENVLKSIAATGIKVEIYQMKHKINLFNKIKLFFSEQKVKTYYVGGPNQNHLGTRMLLDGSTEPYSVVIPGMMGFLTPRYSTKENQWRDRRIFYTNDLSNIKEIKVEFTDDPQKSFIYDNRTNKPQLKDINGNIINNVDSAKVYRYLINFSSVSFERFLDELSQNMRDSIMSLKVENIISISTKDTTIVFKTIKKGAVEGDVDPITGLEVFEDRDRLYGLINKDKELTLCQYHEFDRIIKPIFYFIKTD